MILDTSFLIQLEREISRHVHGLACQALETFLAHETLHITDTVAGELAAGESLSERGRWESFIRSYPILDSGKEVAWYYGRIVRELRKQGSLIGANDLWIAATALRHDMAVVTRNVQDFQRVPGLAVLSF
jgi:tRNA(fMet)-specific endonuclease VapC